MKAYPFLVIGGLLFLLFAFGKFDIHFWSYTEANSSPTSVAPPTLNLPSSAGLGEGRRTVADARWIRRMNRLCRRRNTLERGLGSTDGTALSTARFAARSVWVWDDYQRRAASVRAPATYMRESGWLQQVDAEKRRGIESILKAAQGEDRNAANAAVMLLTAFSNGAHPKFAKIGLTECG